MTDVLGTVHLVGAGPGDPGLLTVRAAELIRRCDCVVHDYLVSPGILALIPTQAERHYVGKRGHSTSITQSDINALLVKLASTHRCIVRLKGGDPFLFGRGGEEAVTLAEASVPFSVVPGVTSGIGAPAYAGIPVTHRAASSVVAFAAGHQQSGDADMDFAALARLETVVLYMGMQRLADNCRALIAHGKPATTPAASIQWGTYGKQRVVTGTLADLAERCQAAKLGAPAITVIGEVVRYRERIRWFDNRPLSGKRVVVTRARDQASQLAARLAEVGAEVIELPLTRFLPVHDSTALDAALKTLADFPWIAFTSANAVRFTWQRLRELKRDARALGHTRIAAVGPGTAAALAECGLNADVLPARFTAEALAEALHETESTGRRILLPQADNARPLLREQLTARGWQVNTVTAYHAETVPLDPAQLAQLNDANAGPVHAVTFASAATVGRFLDSVGHDRVIAMHAAGCQLVAIGPQTASALTTAGFTTTNVADDATIDGLVTAVIKACQ